MKQFEKKFGRHNAHIDKFSGIDEVVNYLERTPADEGFRDVVTGSHELRKGFNGADSYEQARGYIKKGVNLKEVKAAIDTGSREYNKKRNVRHVAGGAPCVPAAVASDPRAMYQRRNERITGAYNVFVNQAYNCNVTPQQAKEAGLKILQEVLRISAIKPVNLYVGAVGIDNERKNVFGYGMQIMDAGKAFNAARVSYALTDTGFFRVFGFGLYERTHGMWSAGNAYSLGSSLVTYDEDLNKKVLNAAFKNMLFVNVSDVIRGKADAMKELENIR